MISELLDSYESKDPEEGPKNKAAAGFGDPDQRVMPAGAGEA